MVQRQLNVEAGGVSTEATTRQRARLDGRVALAVTITVLSWGSAFPAIRAATFAYEPTHVALLRYLIASATLLGYALLVRMPLPDRRDVPRLALAGLIGIGVYNGVLNTGIAGIPSGTASLIVNFAPVLVAVLARFFLGERLRAWGWIGSGVSLAGVATIAAASGSGIGVNPSAWWVLGAAVAQAIYVIMQKPLLRRYTALQFTTYAIWTGTLGLLVFSGGLIERVFAAPTDTTLAVVYLGVFPAAIGYVAWSYVVAHVPASTAVSFLYAVPVVAFTVGWLWLGEVPRPLALVGGALVIGGVVLVNTRGRGEPPRRQNAKKT